VQSILIGLINLNEVFHDGLFHGLSSDHFLNDHVIRAGLRGQKTLAQKVGSGGDKNMGR
jgi:hypothetical protein